MRDIVCDIPKTIAKETGDEFSFELNEIGELRISSKYEPTTFVLYGKHIKVLSNIIRKANEMGKEIKSWDIKCAMCQTTVRLEAETIISTDQCAEFIIVPDIICGKCKSVCIKEIVDVT